MVLGMRDPFATLLAVQRAMDEAMRSDWFGSRTTGRGAFPPVNVFSEGDDYVVVAELAGVKKEDLDVQIKGDTVRIQGKKTLEQADDVSVHRRERAEGQFDRTLSFPAQLDVAKAAADYRDGVLTLRLPRAESEKARSVTIN
jgi:HSP20 family protein